MIDGDNMENKKTIKFADGSEKEVDISYKFLIDLLVRQAVCFALHGHYNEKFKIRAAYPFTKVIDYKFKGEADKILKLQICLLGNIEEQISNVFPFLNLDGIDLTWSLEQLQDQVFLMLQKVPKVNLEDCNIVKKADLTKHKKSDKQLEVEDRLEKLIRTFFKISSTEKFRNKRIGNLFEEKLNVKLENWYLDNEYCKPYQNQYRTYIENSQISTDFCNEIKKEFNINKPISIGRSDRFQELVKWTMSRIKYEGAK